MGSSGFLLGLWSVASVTAVGGWNVAKYFFVRADNDSPLEHARHQLDGTASSASHPVDVA